MSPGTVAGCAGVGILSGCLNGRTEKCLRNSQDNGQRCAYPFCGTGEVSRTPVQMFECRTLCVRPPVDT